MEVGAAALGVWLAAITPEDGVSWHTLGSHRRLGLGLGICGCPLLVVTELLLTDDPLGRLLSVAAAAAALVLQSTGLGIRVDEGKALECVLLEVVSRLLVLLLHLHETCDGLLRRLQGESLLLLIKDDITPLLALEHSLVHLFYELRHGVLTAHEGVT